MEYYEDLFSEPIHVGLGDKYYDEDDEIYDFICAMEELEKNPNFEFVKWLNKFNAFNFVKTRLARYKESNRMEYIDEKDYIILRNIVSIIFDPSELTDKHINNFYNYIRRQTNYYYVK